MKLLSDYHTHSKFSKFGHGKNTIEEMAYRANELGLEEFAITDHGLKNLFGTSKEKLKRARIIIDDINTWSKTKILLGIEADILNTNGDLDIDDEVLDLIDVLCIGYHPGIKTDFAGFFGGQKKNQTAIDRATNAYINAINRYPVNFITHIDSVLTTDLYKIGCACYENDVAIEINDRHVNWTKEQVDALLKSKCMFIVNSDAHSVEEIGRSDFAFKTIEKFGIPAFSLVNVEFSEKEMSEEDKEMEMFYGIFKDKQALNDKKTEAFEEKKKTEFTNTLSKEMEDALKNIAIEKGITYTVDKAESKAVSKEELIDEVAFYMNEIEKRKMGYSLKKDRYKEEEHEEELEEEPVYEDDVGSSDFFSSVYGNTMKDFAMELEKDYLGREDYNKKSSFGSSYNNDNDEELSNKSTWSSANNYSEYEEEYDNFEQDNYTPEDEQVFETEKTIIESELDEEREKYGNDKMPKPVNSQRTFAESQSFYSGKRKDDDAVQTPAKHTPEPNKNLLSEVNFEKLKQQTKTETYDNFSLERLKKFEASNKKDSSYSKFYSEQESQFEQLKNSSKSASKNSSNGNISDFFDDSIDASNFNVNKKGDYSSQGAYSQNNSIEVQRNTAPASKGINKGTFIGFSNNVSNQIHEEKVEEPVIEVPKKKPGLSNGLVDFSSLKDDE